MKQPARKASKAHRSVRKAPAKKTRRRAAPARTSAAAAAPAENALAFAREEFDAASEAALTAGAKKEFRRIFDLTLGSFVERSQQHFEAFKTNAKMRRFLKREIGKIARQAARKAHGGNISAADLQRAAVEVMVATNRHCKAAVDETGRVIVAQQGEVCATFIASEG